MMTRIFKSGSCELSVAVSPVPENGLVCALLDQQARCLGDTPNYGSALYKALSKRISTTLHALGCYSSGVPQIVQQVEVYRDLVEYLQCSIEIRFPDGLVRTYPRLYCIDEPVYRLYCDFQTYYSVIQVRHRYTEFKVNN